MQIYFVVPFPPVNALIVVKKKKEALMLSL